MEESEKRRERLKAMRLEAAQSGVHSTAEHSMVSHGLANPLIETSATPPAQVESYVAPKFDFYTDPMSAFTANKRGSQVSHQISQQDYFTPPRPRSPMSFSPSHQPPIHYSQDCQAFQPQGVYQTSSLYRSPIGMGGHFGSSQTTPDVSPDYRMFQAQGVYHTSSPYRSPIGMSGSFDSPQATPGVWSASGGTSGYGFPSDSSRGGNFPSPGFTQRGSPRFDSDRGRGHWINNSPGGNPGPNSGRGRGRWLGSQMGPGSGRSGKRGGYRDHVSAELRPDLFYHKSMVEDPWKFLKPVISRRENVTAKSLDTPDSQKSWLPKSISMKKARVSESSSKFGSQPSLAEYLAASFSEAANNEAVNEKPSV